MRLQFMDDHQKKDEKKEFVLPELKREALEEIHQEHLIRVNHQNPEPPVRGEGLLRRVDLALVRLNSWIEKWVPEDLNPLSQTGAVANISLFICIVSGILLLFWYSTSVHTAYSSLEAMKSSPWTSQLIRSLHRYSADVCMLFVLLHALQILVGRRFGGPRWVAWITGIILMGFLWFDGWTGYWLVWDEKAGRIALETTKILDYLPIFAEPLTRSFLTDQSVNTLVFFLIFFLHMLIPLGMGIALWIHIARLNRPRFLTTRNMALSIFVSLVVVSLLFPAYSAKPAKMQVISQEFPLDWFYMAPLWMMDSLKGGVFWLIAFLGGLVFFTLPWWMTKRHAESALVLDQRCNGCGQCFQDCPYNAITLISLKDAKWEHQARIDPDKCVGCGICVGSCNPGAIIFPKLPVQDAREKINEWLEQILNTEEKAYIAFLCANSAGSDLELDGVTGKCRQLPGYRIIPVPCSGWVHPLMIERALKGGAEGVLVVGCGPDPMYRTGTLWTELRLTGERTPVLRESKIDRAKVRFMRYDRSSREDFLRAAREFVDEKKGDPSGARQGAPRPFLAYGVTLLILVIFGMVSWFFSEVSYRPPQTIETELVVSFSHPGQYKKQTSPKGDQKDLLPHMRGASQSQRTRVPVRMRLFVDGKKVLEKSYAPHGLFQDSASVAIEHLSLKPGKHQIRIQIGDSEKESRWNYTGEKVMEFKRLERRVVLFGKSKGFQWH